MASALSKLLLLSGLWRSDASERLDQLSSEFRGIRLSAGDVLQEPGKTTKWLGVVEKGSIRQTYFESNRSLTISKYLPGQLFGANEIIRGSTFFGLNACEDSVVYIVEAEKFVRWQSIDIVQPEVLSSITNAELFEVLRKTRTLLTVESIKLLDFSRATLKHDSDQLSVFDARDYSNQSGQSGMALISSSNFFELSIGDSLDLGASEPPSSRGQMPGRLLLLSATIKEQLNDLTLTRTSASAGASSILSPTQTTYDSSLVKLKELSLNEEASSRALRDWYGDGIEEQDYPNVECDQSDNAGKFAIAILQMLSQYFKIPYRKDSVERAIDQRLKDNPDAIFTSYSYATLLEIINIKTEILKVETNHLQRLQFPALIRNEIDRVILLWEINDGTAVLSDGSKDSLRLPLKDFLSTLQSTDTIEVLCFSRGAETKIDRFGLSWFIPSLLRHKATLALVVLASFFVQLLALLNPLLIQQIIDAVISQGNITSLNVYGTLLIGMAVTEGVLSSLRTFLLSDTTNRIDLSLGALVIDHLMRLPLNYFARRPVGEVSSRVNELEKIREFLTGTGMTSILDAVFSVVYIAVMLTYSVSLTLWSLSVIPFFIVLSFFVSPLIRRQIEKRSESYARVQSHLVEALGGIETIKTQSLEYQTKWRWRQLYNKQISRAFKNTLTTTSAGSVAKFLEQLSGLIIIWVGASLVLQSKLTIGQLIAFRILSGYVTGPILRLATLWQNFQETGISIQRLGDVINTPTEADSHGIDLIPLPPIHGHIEYRNVDFRFTQNGPLQLNRVSLDIAPGSFVGIVGGSGSGKSTLVKLLSALYKPEKGSIMIDGYDISKVDLYSLRSQIGIVPQDSLLFDGSVRENVSLSRPDATLDEINEAIRVACADDFVAALPLGLSSSVGERGSGLSGGQRQRIAIARMLISRPSLVILDEATSALDVDTERRVLKNLAAYLKNTTLIFITHRISTLKEADKIVVMQTGMIDESGSHEELLAMRGRYAALLSQQYAEGLVE